MSTDASTLDFEITQRPDFALLAVHLQHNQQVFAEPSAMVSMDPTITLKAGLKGGIKATLGRSLGGESMIMNTFTADRGPGEVTFAPGPAGDLFHHHLTGNALFVQRGSYVAHSEGVDVTGAWQGAKGFFSGEGLVLLKAHGAGDVFFNSYGAVLDMQVTDDYVVDTGYIVAFEDTLQYNVTTLPGLRSRERLKSLFFSGEGLVCRFTGVGRVWVQTRQVAPFLSWVNPFRPAKSNN